MTYRESLEKEKITLNGNDYVPLEKVKEILDEIENELGVIPNLLKLLYQKEGCKMKNFKMQK